MTQREPTISWWWVTTSSRTIAAHIGERDYKRSHITVVGRFEPINTDKDWISIPLNTRFLLGLTDLLVFAQITPQLWLHKILQVHEKDIAKLLTSENTQTKRLIERFLLEFPKIPPQNLTKTYVNRMLFNSTASWLSAHRLTLKRKSNKTILNYLRECRHFAQDMLLNELQGEQDFRGNTVYPEDYYALEKRPE